MIGLYENDNYTNDNKVKEVVLFMKEVSEKIFNKFWEKKKGKR